MGHFYAPPPPIVSATGAQAYAPNRLPPAVEAVPVNEPPYTHPGRTPVAAEIVALTLPRNLNPALTAVRVDNPLPEHPEQWIETLVVKQLWQPDAWPPVFDG